MGYKADILHDLLTLKPAVLVIAHGSPEHQWNERVEHAVAQAKLPLPVRVAFLSHVPERSIQSELAALEMEGVETMIVIPLFVSKGSTHLDDIRMMLGLMDQPLHMKDIQPLRIQARLIWCSPLHDAAPIRQIWESRLLELIHIPEQETLLVIGHGSEKTGYKEKWQQLLQSAVDDLQERFGLRQADYATLLPDNVRAKAMELKKAGRLLVLPLFVSEGYFTQKAIPRRLEGLAYEYRGQTYLPHTSIAAWIQETVTKQLGAEFRRR